MVNMTEQILQNCHYWTCSSQSPTWCHNHKVDDHIPKYLQRSEYFFCNTFITVVTNAIRTSFLNNLGNEWMKQRTAVFPRTSIFYHALNCTICSLIMGYVFYLTFDLRKHKIKRKEFPQLFWKKAALTNHTNHSNRYKPFLNYIHNEILGKVLSWWVIGSKSSMKEDWALLELSFCQRLRACCLWCYCRCPVV